MISTHAQAKMLQIAMLGARRTSYHALTASLTRLNLQPEKHQNVQKTHSWQKVPGVNGLTLNPNLALTRFQTTWPWLAKGTLMYPVNEM